GCVNDYDTTIVNQPTAALTHTLDSTDVTCFGFSNGAANLTVSGGTLPYTFNWSNGATTEDLTGVIAGTYAVSITDANGCVNDYDTTIVNQPTAALTHTLDSTDVTCFGFSNGATNLTVSGGTPPSTFNWSNGATTEDLTGIIAGIYAVSITDANGCIIDDDSITVNQPSAALSNTLDSTDVTCFGFSNGTTDLTVTGGTTPYTYNWSNGATTKDLNAVPLGTYAVSITDANGCVIGYDTIVINQPSAALTHTLDSTDVTCFGLTDGATNLTVSGGTTPYIYNWSNGTTTEDLSGIGAGIYAVSITDANGCFIDDDSITVNEPAQTIVSAGANDTVCANNAVVALTGSVSGGITTTGIWTTSGNGTFSPGNTTLIVTYTPSTLDTIAGSVTLILTSTNNLTCATVADTMELLIEDGPVVSAGVDDSTCRTNPDYVLNGSVLHGDGQWTTSGDGTFSPNDTVLNATYLAGTGDTTAGSVTLILTSTNIGNCVVVTDTMILTFTPDAITVNAGPDDTVCRNQITVQLNGSITIATGAIWTTLGSGTFAPSNTTLNATYQPSVADTVAGNVCLVLRTTGNGGCVAKTDTMCINLFDLNIAVDAGNPQIVCANSDSLTLNGSVTGAAGGIWVTLGSGTFSPNDSSLTASYIFSAADTAADSVVIVLTSYGNQGCNVVIDSMAIKFVPGPQADFTYSKICQGDTVFFDADSSSSSPIVGWYFNFDDSNTDTVQHTYNIYSSPGAYNVMLAIESNTGCEDTMIKQVIVHPNPVADFNTTAGCFVDSAYYYDLSTIYNDVIVKDSIVSWNWDFGDTNGDTLQNTSHVYASVATYNISLAVASSFGCVDTIIDTVKVLPGPDMDFTMTLPCLADSVYFTSSATIVPPSIIVGWTWVFGDGDSSFVQNPAHLYDTAGIYTVKFIATTDSGCSNVFSKDITVYPMPVADFGYTAVCEDQSTSFFDSSTVAFGSISAYYWDFGDGDTSTIKDPTHVYDTAGTFWVKHVAISTVGCTDTVTLPVLSHPVPIAIMRTTAGCYVDSAYFFDESIILNDTLIKDSAFAWVWTFGD
ncbi:PKD domain-containing protein, partial [bacterium AH-315-C07]|nr:PKD domain-containing protein [bacterium AH-315-C07]